MEPFDLEIWRLHPKSAKIEKAEKTLNGTANEAGVKFCRPYSSVNALGWWVFPPADFDIIWKGGREFDHRMLEPWPHSEHDLIKSLVRPTDKVNSEEFAPVDGRSKFTFGAVEDGVVQIWTGCIFKTPPGWCLQIRSPINSPSPDYFVMEGVLETDWMQYDIWTNIVFQTQNKWIEFRKDSWPPLAQLIPIRRESVDGPWKTAVDQVVNRDTPEANKIFEYWIQYNKKKFGVDSKGKFYLSENRTKDSTVFWRERAALLNKETYEPKPEALEVKPLPSKKKIKLVKRKSNVHSTSSDPAESTTTSSSFPGTNSAELGENLSPHDN